MIKESYEKAVIEIELFDAEEIIRTSGDGKTGETPIL